MGKELKRLPHKHGHICVGFFLTSSPTSVPTSVFSFFPVLIVEKNLCNTLGLATVGVDLLGSLGLVRVDLLGSSTKKVGDFQYDCAGVRHWVILVTPRRVRKIN